MKFKSVFSLVLLLILLPVIVLAAETPWGKTRVLGNEESRKNIKLYGHYFAPLAIMTTNTCEDEIYLAYRYCRFDANTRVWQMKLVDADDNVVDFTGNIRIVLPYPAVWSSQEGGYWKWTEDYANRYRWAYSLGYSKFAYQEFNGANSVAGYYIGSPKLLNKNEEEIKRSIKAEGFPFEEYMDGLHKIDCNDEYGHKIKIKCKSGTFPSVCIEMYDEKPRFNECTIKETFEFLGFNTLKTYIFQGFIVDNRPDEYKYSPRFRLFLERRQSEI